VRAPRSLNHRLSAPPGSMVTPSQISGLVDAFSNARFGRIIPKEVCTFGEMIPRVTVTL
jgi:hypothetical protein